MWYNNQQYHSGFFCLILLNLLILVYLTSIFFTFNLKYKWKKIIKSPFSAFQYKLSGYVLSVPKKIQGDTTRYFCNTLKRVKFKEDTIGTIFGFCNILKSVSCKGNTIDLQCFFFVFLCYIEKRLASEDGRNTIKNNVCLSQYFWN